MTGLGVTEMRLLEMLARGFENTNALFHLQSLRSTRIFQEFEIGCLLDGLAQGSRPAAAGLDDELRESRTDKPGEIASRHTERSRLSLTEFGEAIVAYEEDFSRHNPIHRWWGGTEADQRSALAVESGAGRALMQERTGWADVKLGGEGCLLFRLRTGQADSQVFNPDDLHSSRDGRAGLA